MPLDLRGFLDEPNQWAGLYRTADQLEKRKLQQQQLAQQQQSKRATAGTFLNNYLDPKDMLTGTDYDPMILQGIGALQQQGAKLVSAGADAPMLMTALGPMVNKLASYSTNAKNINARIDEQLKGMKDSGIDGYNFAALKQEALKNAFYKTDDKGQAQLDPDSFDPSVDHVAQAIQKNPLAVTNADVFDEFAKKAEKFTTSSDVTTYTPTGTTYRSKADLISPSYMVPETVWDPKAKEHVTTGFVPKHDIATEQGQPLFHTFDKSGKQVREPVRLLDEQEFDKGLTKAMQDRIRGMVQDHIKEYSNKSGKEIDINSPEAKLVGRAIAYDMLNVASRKGGSIKHMEQQGKLSPQQISLNIGGSDKYLDNLRKQTEVRTRARLNVTDGLKSNPAKVFSQILNGNPDYLQGETLQINGKNVIDVTETFKGGGLKAGRGENFKYKNIYYNPEEQVFTVEKESKDKYGITKTETKEIPKSELNKFIYQIAEANGLKIDKVNEQLKAFGLEDADPAAQDFNKRKSWKDASKKAVDAIKSPFGKSF